MGMERGCQHNDSPADGIPQVMTYDEMLQSDQVRAPLERPDRDRCARVLVVVVVVVVLVLESASAGAGGRLLATHCHCLAAACSVPIGQRAPPVSPLAALPRSIRLTPSTTRLRTPYTPSGPSRRWLPARFPTHPPPPTPFQPSTYTDTDWEGKGGGGVFVCVCV